MYIDHSNMMAFHEGNNDYWHIGGW